MKQIRFRYDAFAFAKKCETQIMKRITHKKRRRKRVVRVLLVSLCFQSTPVGACVVSAIV